MVMGLAAYGTPQIAVDAFYEIAGGRFVFKPDVPNRIRDACEPKFNSEQNAMLSASGQEALERGVIGLVNRLRVLSDSATLSYAGGVALNVICNELVIRSGRFKSPAHSH